MTAVRLWWTPGGRAFHRRSTCWKRVGEHPKSELAVVALPGLLAAGMHVCPACSGNHPNSGERERIYRAIADAAEALLKEWHDYVDTTEGVDCQIVSRIVILESCLDALWYG